MNIGEWLIINEKIEVTGFEQHTVHILFEFFTFPFILAFDRDELNDNKMAFTLRILWFRANYKGNGFNIDPNSVFAQIRKYKVIGKWMFEWRNWY